MMVINHIVLTVSVSYRSLHIEMHILSSWGWRFPSLLQLKGVYGMNMIQEN